jgi:CDP-paratose synthetase
MRIAITGATGTLGSALARALLRRGDAVVVLSRTPDALRRLDGLPVAAYAYTAEGLETTLAAGPLDALVHAACSYGRNGESPADLVEANALAPLRLALAGGARIGHWISIGTALPRNVSPYALSKAHFADWLEALPAGILPARDILLLEHFYGPGDDPSKFLTRVARACLAGEALELTAGTQERDFIHLDDAVAAIIAVLDRPQPGCRTMAVGSGTAVAIRTVVEGINRLAGGRSALHFGAVPMRANEPARCVADTAALRRLGWSPAVSLESGLAALVASEQSLRTHP